MNKKKYKYEFAISFANEDRNAAIALVLALKKAGVGKIYYYPKERAKGCGKELKTQLIKIYSEEAKYAIVLFSDHYFDEEKTYTKDVELKAIEMRMKSDSSVDYMLPVLLFENFNFKNYPTLEGLKYIPWDYDPERIAAELIKEFGIKISELHVSNKKKKTNNTIIIKGSKVENTTFIQAGRDVKTTNSIIHNNYRKNEK